MTILTRNIVVFPLQSAEHAAAALAGGAGADARLTAPVAGLSERAAAEAGQPDPEAARGEAPVAADLAAGQRGAGHEGRTASAALSRPDNATAPAAAATAPHELLGGLERLGSGREAGTPGPAASDATHTRPVAPAPAAAAGPAPAQRPAPGPGRVRGALR